MKIIKDKNKKQTILSSILFIVIIALYIELNVLIGKINIPDIDVTDSKIYTLSNQSKEIISKIDKNIKIELFNFEDYMEEASVCDLLGLMQQYYEVNNKISFELGNSDEQQEIVSKYPYLIISSEYGTHTLLFNDLFLYRYSTENNLEEEYYISEEAITNSILSVAKEHKENLYIYLEKSVYKESMFTSVVNRAHSFGLDVKTLNLSENKTIPDDCNCIIIPILTQWKEDNNVTLDDFSDEETQAIENYIKNGGNIIFLQESKSLLDGEAPNLDYIMGLYGISISDGIILDKENSIQNAIGNIYANINYNNDVFKNLHDVKLCMADATKIDLEDDEKLKELGVTYKVLATTSKTAYLRKDMTNNSNEINEHDEEAGNAILGICVEKDVNGKTSKAIVFSNSVFALNSPIYINDTVTNKNMGVEMVLMDDNGDVIASSVKYLTNNNIIMKRKLHYNMVNSSKIITDGITLKIIFVIPMLLIFVGYIVWRYRKNKK